MQALFMVTFIIELIFGIGFIIAQSMLLGTFGVTLDAFGISLARMFGSAVLALATLAWYARKSNNSDLSKAALRSFFVYWLASTIFQGYAQLNGLMNTMGWSTIIMHLGFLIWTGVYAFKKYI